jgi:1-acyl-sn-glycerol-3-phosphate acyltransferase
VPILPVGITGTENMPLDSKATDKPWFRRRITVTIGEPFRLPPRRPGEKLDLSAATDLIMLEIAALLPPQYRGVYAERLAAGDDLSPPQLRQPPPAGGYPAARGG